MVHLKNVDALFFLFLREKQFLDVGGPPATIRIYLHGMARLRASLS